MDLVVDRPGEAAAVKLAGAEVHGKLFTQTRHRESLRVRTDNAQGAGSIPTRSAIGADEEPDGQGYADDDDRDAQDPLVGPAQQPGAGQPAAYGADGKQIGRASCR